MYRGLIMESVYVPFYFTETSSNEVLCVFVTGFTSETLERVESTTNLEQFFWKNMQTQLKYENNMCN